MSDEPASSINDTEQASAVEHAIIDRLAALDDRLGGHDSAPAHLGAPERGAEADDAPADPALNAAVDTILLLRQVAAANRDTNYDPIILPQQIGRYEILREAGRGAFAYVLEAHDEILHRRVALKVARPESLVSVPFRRRFIREAELAARLIHPHVVAVHEVGEEGGLVFIASEYCVGGDLADWLERHPGPMPPRQAAELVRSLASAVDYAHANGVVHRDIKPGNVLLAPRSGRSAGSAGSGDVPIEDMTAKLGDFGLGKLFHDRGAEELTQLTRTGTRLGTPAWMAPEQIDRSFGDVGPATDIHALGLLLDRLLTGRCLFAGRTEAEIFRAVLLEEPTATSGSHRHVPRDLSAVCLKCLAKRPADRYRSAADLAADLSRFLAGVPTLARPLSAPARVARSIARRPLFSLLAAVAVGGLLLAVRAARERDHAVQKQAQAEVEIGRLESATELRRGFEAWRTGNAAAAMDHLRACSTMDSELAGSLAGRWLLARLHGEHDTLLAPANPLPPRPDLYCFASARDGRTLAAGGAAGRLFILRLTSDGGPAGPPLVIAAHDEVNDVAFSPDGLRVASAGEDGRLCIWNVSDGSLAREAHRAMGPLFAAAFSPGGDRLVCGGAHQRLCVIPATAGAEARELQPFAAATAEGSLAADSDIESLQHIDDDRIAVACGGMVAIVDLADGDIEMLLQGHAGTVGQVAVSSDGKKLLSGGTDREPRVWELATGRLLLTLPRHPWWVQGCDFSPDGRTIATGCRDGVVRIFDAVTGEQERQIVGHVGRTWDVKYDPAGMVLSGGADGTLRRWALSAAPDAIGMREVRIPGLTDSSGLGRGQRCAIGIVEHATAHSSILLKLENRIVSLDTATRSLTETPAPASQLGFNIAVDPDRRRFAAVPRGGPIELHPLPEKTAVDPAGTSPAPVFRQLPGVEEGAAKDVVWTPSGMLIAGCDGGRLLAWNAALDDVTLVDRLERTVDAVRLAPAGDSRLAIAAGRLIRIYSVPSSGPPAASNAKTILTLADESGVIVKLAWSPDGRRIAYGTNHGHVATIDAATGATLGTFPKHAREVMGLAWSPAGRTVISADIESVRFSDVATTMTFDELRPGWSIEDLEVVGFGAAGTGPLLVIAGSAATAVEGSDREARVGILDLHRSLEPARSQP